MRTVVTFESSAFNSTEERPNFLNPGCFGDDVARWLIGKLTAAGLQVDDEPDQEDFGWYFNFRVPEGPHCLVVGFRPGDAQSPGTWIVWIERQAGFLGSLFGGRRRGIADSAVRAVFAALSHAPEIHNARWHEGRDLDRGGEPAGRESP